MSVKEAKPGKWLVQIDRKGIPRIRRTFDVKSEAEIFEREYLAKHQQEIQQNGDRRTLKELIEIWYRYHGINLSDSEKFKRMMISAANDMGNPIGSQFTPTQFVNYRYERTISGKSIVTAKTFNNVHGFLSSMFSRLKRLKIIDYDNPLAEVDFIKIHERQMSYLSKEQIDRLLEYVKFCRNPSTWFVVNLCLRTGARWNEANLLKRKQLHAGRVTYEFTKSKKTRSIPLDEPFYESLMEFAKYKNPEDRIFTNCISGYRKAIDRSGIELPKGQLSHVLRHSFASHFMMNNGNILTLQHILGHADIKMTLRYAHLAPSHLEDAKKLNPLAW
ncbi:phage integrase [Methylobacter sp.]|uniref:phage integrase n=1 Tax=Methylobacter sp. TaxID=2051955 RepID=UPI003DA55547